MTISGSLRDMLRNGAWRDLTGPMLLLAVCPLLAAATSLISGLGLGLATLAVLCVTNAVVPAGRAWIPPEARLPALLILIAAVVTVVDLACQALFFELHLALGIFLPLLMASGAILVRAEIFSSHHGLLPSLSDGLAQGAGLTAVLAVVGGLREWLGEGGLVLALAPAGAFFVLALLLAMRNAVARNRAPGRAEPGS